MINTQVIATTFISLPWAIMYMYYNISASYRTAEQQVIINFAYILTNYCFYLNYVKSFYLSMLTSRVFRQTFVKALIKLLPHHLYRRRQVPPTNMSILMNATKINQQNKIQHATERLH